MMLWYPVQRHRLPDSASRISRSPASGWALRKAVICMRKPGVQKPHWNRGIPNRLLQRAERAVGRQPLDVVTWPAACTASIRQDAPACRRRGRARAADAVLAPDVGAGQVEVLAQEVGQRLARLHRAGARGPVYLHGDIHHRSPAAA